MKKITLLAAVVIAASFASCKKAATCECSVTTSMTRNGVAVNYGSGYTRTETRTTEISKTGKKTAAAMCGNTSDVTTEVYTSGSTTTTDVTTTSSTCAIK